jgi:hypothetical protein
MKPEFPVLYAKASMLVATPLIGLVGAFYVVREISQPASEVYGFAMGAFGITAALSGICFTVSESVPGSSDFRYAGEKFLHSSVLIVQTVMLVYLKDFLTGASWLSNLPRLGTFVRVVPLALLPLLSFAAAIAWYFGFDSINSRLWQNWKQRIEDINKRTSNSDPAKNTRAKGAS